MDCGYIFTDWSGGVDWKISQILSAHKTEHTVGGGLVDIFTKNYGLTVYLDCEKIWNSMHKTEHRVAKTSTFSGY